MGTKEMETRRQSEPNLAPVICIADVLHSFVSDCLYLLGSFLLIRNNMYEVPFILIVHYLITHSMLSWKDGSTRMGFTHGHSLLYWLVLLILDHWWPSFSAVRSCQNLHSTTILASLQNKALDEILHSWWHNHNGSLLFQLLHHSHRLH